MVLPCPDARPLMAARAASTASSGSDLPWLRRDCRLGRLTSTTSTPSSQEPGEPDPIGAGALDADLGHLAEALEPDQQGLVAAGVSVERLGADQSDPAGRVPQPRGLSRWVSTPPVIPGAASTMVMAIPSFLKRLRGGTAVPDRSDGWSIVRSKPDHHPLGTGRAAPRLCWSGAPTDGVQMQSCSPRDLKSGRATPVLPKLQRTNHSAVDPHGSSTTSLVFRGHLEPSPLRQPGGWIVRQDPERRSYGPQ